MSRRVRVRARSAKPGIKRSPARRHWSTHVALLITRWRLSDRYNCAPMTIDEQLAYLTKGCVDVVRAGELKTKLERSQATGQPLVVKVGFDPTAPDLHLGHTVLIRK